MQPSQPAQHPTVQSPASQPLAAQPLAAQLPVMQPVAAQPPTSQPLAGGQPQVIMVPSRSWFREIYDGRRSKMFGTIQIIGGILAIILQAVVIALDYYTHYIGAGIWCGAMFIVTGSFGIAAGKFRSMGLIITYMILAIISAAMTSGIVFGILPSLDGEYLYPVIVALNILLLVVGLVELITLIWGSVLGCKAACCCCQLKQQHVTVAAPYAGGQIPVTTGPSQIQVVPTMPYAGQLNGSYSAPQPDGDKQPLVPDSPPPQYRMA